MRKIKMNSLHLWQFENLQREPGIKHFVTDRRSNENSKEFTLSFSSSPIREEIVGNRAQLAEAMGLPDNRLFFPSQVHNTRIVHVTVETPKQELMETDALMTNENNICIAVMSADCVPILLYDKANKAIAAVHSGWKGTVAKILDKTLHAMHKTYGTKGKDIIAGIGPSVSQPSYQVGEEVIVKVNEAFGPEHTLLIHEPGNKARLDLWAANQLQLLGFGVPSTQIEVSDLCTVQNNNHFFSARKGDTGRFAAGIALCY